MASDLEVANLKVAEPWKTTESIKHYIKTQHCAPVLVMSPLGHNHLPYEFLRNSLYIENCCKLQ